MLLPFTIAAGLVMVAGSRGHPPAVPVLAIVGATVIDGNGGAPLQDGVVIIREGIIAAVGPRAEIKVPKDAQVIEAGGRFLVPGFIDTNVHLSLYSGLESLARYEDRFTAIAIEGAQ